MKSIRTFLLLSILFMISMVSNAQSFKAFNDSCSIDYLNGEEVYELVEEPPEYPGGIGAFYKTIGKHMKISDKYKKMGGLKVYILFIIGPNGEIVYQCSNDGSALPLDHIEKWKPGVMKGKKVYVKMILPISIKLG